MAKSSDEIISLVMKEMEDKKAMNIVTLNLQEISLIADYFVICHGNSDVQVQAIATAVRKKAEEEGVPILRVEGYRSGRWVLVDLGDVIVHIFHRDDRDYYNLERLWSDAKVVETV